MNSYGQTDAGRVRKSNQDSIFLSGMPVGPLSNLFMVADGMGGTGPGILRPALWWIPWSAAWSAIKAIVR